MEISVRHCMLEVPHDDQREIGAKYLECSSKCEDGFLKENFLKSIGECVGPAAFSAVAME